MSIDRYDLIVNAVKSRKRRTTTKALMTNIAVWLGMYYIYRENIDTRITHYNNINNSVTAKM